MSSRGVYLFEASPPKGDGKQSLQRVWPVFGPTEQNPEAQALLARLGGRDTIDYTAMYQAQFLRGFHALGFSSADSGRGRKLFDGFIAKFDRNPFHYSETAVIVTPEGYRYWEEHGREAVAKMRAEREAALAAVARMVLIGCKCTIRPRLSDELRRQIPQGVSLPLPERRIVRPYATATFIKKTTTRIYVRDVKVLPSVGEMGWRNHPVGGNSPNQYVSPDAIMVDGCDAALAERLHAIASEFQNDIDAIGERMVGEMLPGLTAMNSRMLQKDAERVDAVTEALRAAGHKIVAPYDHPEVENGISDEDEALPRP